MINELRSAIMISASSDIGTAMCRRWKTKGWEVFGTYRTESQAVDEMSALGIKLIHCDLSDTNSINEACRILRELCLQWDVLVISSGSQDPVGRFSNCNFDEWEKSIGLNFSSQMRIIHELLPSRRTNACFEPCVLLFAGAGTNNAPVNYSAYIVSKIALIKMCELLDAEIQDTKFTIVGPGWVKTKIHESTLRAGPKLGDNYQKTLKMLAGDNCTPTDQVLDCCDWLVNAPRNLVSGRNFSVVFDLWGTPTLEEKLSQESNMYKLRRYGNDLIVKK